MQPTIICTAPVPGMVCLNGRFAGEASAERPLFAPVSPSGPLYIEYRPLEGEGVGLARRLVLSGGAPLAGALEDAAGLWCVAWPGGALEVELGLSARAAEHFTLEGRPCALLRGDKTSLALGGLELHLPRGAGLPRLERGDGVALLRGEVAGGGQYLAALSPDLSAPLGLLTARVIEPMDGGLFSAFVDLGDSVGHGRLEQWLADGRGLSRVSSQSAWSRGGPRWPQTGEATAIAAVEAMLAGLPDEAEGYLSPALATRRPLAAVGQACDLCVPMKYALPDARPCVGLLEAVNDHLAAVRPLYYRVEPSGGGQGPWQVSALSLE